MLRQASVIVAKPVQGHREGREQLGGHLHRLRDVADCIFDRVTDFSSDQAVADIASQVERRGSVTGSRCAHR